MKLESKTLIQQDVSATEFNSIKRANEENIIRILNNEAKYFLKKNFDMDLKVPVKLNNRLSSTLGRFRYYRNGLPIGVDIQTKFAVSCIIIDKIDILLDVLRHELVHYALFAKGIPNDDGCIEFESKLKELGVGSSNATSLSKVQSFFTTEIHVNNVYSCDKCGSKGSVISAKKNVLCECHSDTCNNKIQPHTKTNLIEIRAIQRTKI